MIQYLIQFLSNIFLIKLPDYIEPHVIPSISNMNEILITYEKIQGLEAKGKIEFGIYQCPIVSGGYGKGFAPKGQYKAISYRKENGESFSKFGIGFFVYIVPKFKSDRTELGIHPDGNVPGTLGCIGIKLGSKDEAETWDKMFSKATYPLKVIIS